MACADLAGFAELAGEFFADVRERADEWRALHASGDHKRLREEYHRTKGGAALFGFERLVVMLAGWEADSTVETSPEDLERLARELAEAEEAVAALLR